MATEKTSYPDELAIGMAENGDWTGALKVAHAVKKNPAYYNIFDRLASVGQGVPPEHIPEFLRGVTHPWDQSKHNHGALQELATHLHPNLQHQDLEMIAKAMGDDIGFDEKRRIESHINWSPHTQENHLKQFGPYAFWHSYEKKVMPEHFHAVAKAFNIPGYADQETHRGEIQRPLENSVLSVIQQAPGALEVSWLDKEKKTPYIGKRSSAIDVQEILPHLEGHAKAHQNKLLDSYYKGNPHGLEMKTFGGKQYIKLYRGVGGAFATKLLDKMELDRDKMSMPNKTLSMSSAPISSWTVDPQMAARFATMRGDHEGGKDSVVMEAWHPIENVVHTGFLKIHPMHDHAHDEESEVVIKHPDLKHKIKSTGIYLAGVGDQLDNSLTKPGIIRKK